MTQNSSEVLRFAPGPWTLTKFDQGFMIHDADGNLVETVYTGEANARLIAAAPDLYAALEKLRDEIGDVKFGSPLMYAVLKANTALAKAVKP
jgi:hypothetical protein